MLREYAICGLGQRGCEMTDTVNEFTLIICEAEELRGW